MNPDGSCSHLYEIGDQDRNDVLKNYRKVMSWSMSEDMMIDVSIHNGSLTTFPSCGLCSRATVRPSVCLQCKMQLCRVSSTLTSPGNKRKRDQDCMRGHFRATGHSLAVDSATGSVWCHACQDWVYALAFEGALGRVRRLQEERLDPSVGENGHSKRVRYKNPKPTEMPLPANLGFAQIRCHSVKPLLNLSQTCFLSAILQALLHNPLWKQYYLSSGHDRKQCALRRAKKLAHGNNKYQPTESIAEGSGLGAEENGPGGLIGVKLSDLGLGLGECMNCEMDGAFAEAYGGDSTPFGPITMLFAMWKANTELAGYAQQDAHAFFLAALNQIHVHDPDCVESPKNCACIAHRTFGGSLLSTVTCSRCGSMTETEDPILDLSLELKKGPPAMDRLTAVERCSPSASLNLADCLRTFTSKESLKDDVYACEKCKAEGRRADVSKQLSFKTLPATLAIQLKRFEHANSNLVKVDTLVNFPTELDMRPYMTDQLRGDTFDMPLEMFHYRLTSVVTHEGKLDNGHYWACVNSGHEWFLMDDEKVTPIALSRVLAQKAYMLFYAKSSLTFA